MYLLHFVEKQNPHTDGKLQILNFHISSLSKLTLLSKYSQNSNSFSVGSKKISTFVLQEKRAMIATILQTIKLTE